MYILKDKRTLLFILLGGFFVANALIAEFIGVKIFSLEKTLGFNPVKLSFFGREDLSFNLTAGVLLWPIVFVMTDVINEYFGRRGVKLLSYLTVVLISYAFFMFYFGIKLIPADFWPTSHLPVDVAQEEFEALRSKVGDYDAAFRLVFGQGLWIIIGSLVAFLIGQFVDVAIFHWIRNFTGEQMIWLRATGSTLFSQFLDSFVVLFIAFYIGANWDFSLVLAIGLVNYLYKFVMAIILTPVIYLAHWIIDAYLGPAMAEEMKITASQASRQFKL